MLGALKLAKKKKRGRKKKEKEVFFLTLCQEKNLENSKLLQWT